MRILSCDNAGKAETKQSRGRTLVNVLVLAVGNVLLRDEGAGVCILEHLADRRAWPSEVRFIDGGTLGFTLSAEIERCDALLVLDAARFGEAPGVLRCFGAAGIDVLLASPRRSVHEVGLADLFDIARLKSRLPDKRYLIGIEPGIVAVGRDLSAAVAAAVPRASDLALDIIESLLAEEPRGMDTERVAIAAGQGIGL